MLLKPPHPPLSGFDWICKLQGGAMSKTTLQWILRSRGWQTVSGKRSGQLVWMTNPPPPTHLDPFNRNVQHIKLSPFLCVCMETQVTYALKQIRCERVRQHQLGTRPRVYVWDDISVLLWNCLFRVLLPCALVTVCSLIGCHLMWKC